MGLLDIDMSTPEGQGFNSALMQAAAMLLTPRARGGGLGSAFAAMPQAIDRAKAQAQRSQLMDMQAQQLGMQTAEMQRKAQAQAEQRANLERLIAGLPQEQRAAARVAPEKFAESFVPPQPKLETIYDDQGREQKAWIARGMSPVPVGGAKQNQMPWEYEYGPDGQLRMKAGVFGAKRDIAAAGAGKGMTFVQEREEDKAVGKAFGERYTKIQDAGFTAQSRIARLDRMEQLLDGLQTGKFTPAMTEFRSALDSLGFKVDETLGPAQAAQALSSEMALAARSTEGGAGMPGAMSDADRQFLVNTVPGLGKTPEGNRLLLETNRRIARRDMQVAKIARDYRKKHGKLDEGFYEELQAFSDANPLFSDMQQAPAAPAAPQELPMPPGWTARRVK